MRVRLIERDIDPAWGPTLAALASSSAEDLTMVRGGSLTALPQDDYYLWVGRSLADLVRDLSELGTEHADRAARTFVLGIPLDFAFGDRRSAPGTLVDVLESHRLAGAFGPEALTTWQDAPSHFAGPKDRMQAIGVAPVKAYQTKNYANWFAAHGSSLPDFLLRYLRFVLPGDTPC